ncbi:adhesion G-protein coupled receptor G6-like isoform X1 [Schistocerca americana]|uniref:adhesion G-protein coupled receptor G6-like isoform X1 n=1 Tax=Schistocerca americana TaxID=7009 RepID=UPI001F4F5A0A|nr:adhesion G-protein coupled receptor G6-like isoform X1 [Schistocerca americana]XP_046989213.1 adhesion G-protein coupled receptor G6-like isoform X1 [Schistocerca americana]
MSHILWVAVLILNADQVTSLSFFSAESPSSRYCVNIIPPTDWQSAFNLCKERGSDKSILQILNDLDTEKFYSTLHLYNIYAFWGDVRKISNSTAGDVKERLSLNFLPWTGSENPGTDANCGLVTGLPGQGGLKLLPSPCHNRHISLCLVNSSEDYQHDGIFCANLTDDKTKREPELTLRSDGRELVLLFPETLLGEYVCGEHNLPEKSLGNPKCWLLGFRPWHQSSAVKLECLSATVLEFNVTKIQMSVTTTGEGYLMCQAWTNKHIKPILSNTVVKKHYNDKQRFALELKLRCSENLSICSNPQKSIEILAADLKKKSPNTVRYLPAAVLTSPTSETLQVILHLIGPVSDNIKNLIKNSTSYELIGLHSLWHCDEEPPLWHLTNADRRTIATDGTAYRMCYGNFTSGAHWGPVMKLKVSNLGSKTRRLHELIMGTGNHTTSALSNLQSIIRDRTDKSDQKLSASDIVIVGLALDSADTEKLNSSAVEAVAEVTAAMTRQDKEVLEVAQQTAESSNVILMNVDRILSEIDIHDVPDEKVLAVTPTFATLVFNLQTAGCRHQIRGLALLKKQDIHEIRSEEIVILRWNDTADTLTAKGVRAAAVLPLQLLSSLMGVATDNLSETELIAQLRRSCLSKDELRGHHDRIVISIFWNDKLFIQQNVQRIKLSTIMGVTVNGHTHMNLDYPLLLKYNLDSETGSFLNIYDRNQRDRCVFWNLNAGGGWSNDGCLPVDSTLTSCACFHTTHFGEMLHGRDHQAILNPVRNTALHYVALVGCVLSTAGLVAIIVTALIFPNWRHQGRAIVQLQLCIALCGLATTLSVRVTAEEFLPDWRPQPGLPCTLSGATLQVFLLASLLWMFAAGLHMRQRLLNPFFDFSPTPLTKQLWASAILCWMLPLALAGVSVWTSQGAYEPPDCYPRGQILQFSVTVPAHMLIAANTLILALCIHITCSSSHKSLRLSNASQMEKRIRRQLLFAIYLSILLGMGWIFGLMHMDAVFNVTASLQGFSIFIFAIVLDEKTRSMWTQLLCNHVGKRQSGIDIRLTCTSSTLNTSTTASVGKTNHILQSRDHCNGFKM